MGKFAVVSLGCAKNLVDSEIMLGQLVNNGWEFTPDFAAADLILVNTCGFIESAKEESIQQILEMAEYKKTGNCRTLVVAGCLVQRYAADLMKDLPEVDCWIGLGEIGDIFGKLKRKDSKMDPLVSTPFLNDDNLPRWQVTLQHTAYVKIAEGCNHRCAYCAIPLIKGGFRSRRPTSVLREVQQLVAAGVKEINLIAQDITMYGHDLEPRTGLVPLLKTLIAEAKPKWIRLLYAYPSGVDEALLELMAREPSLCKYLDFPLQHINARILKLMNRVDPPEAVREKIRLIRERVPEITLRTTFITGLPSETQAEFMELIQFVKETQFDHVGVFTYSREEGTAAAEMKPQIRQIVKEKRKNLLLLTQQEISNALLKQQVGQERNVLIDRIEENGQAVGRTQSMAPDVDGVVYVSGFRGLPGEMVRCHITGNDQYNLFATALNVF